MNKVNRIILLVVLVILSVMCLSGCGNKKKKDKIAMNVDIITNEDGTQSTVRNGDEQYFFTVKEGQTYTVNLDFKNESGKIDCYIALDGDKKNADYVGTDIPSSNFSVTVSKAGQYKILYHAKDYIGKYSYSVNKQ